MSPLEKRLNNIINLDTLNSYRNQRLKVGIVGGSFDPAHQGHIHIALNALEKLGLDQVWFALSPQNPLKAPHKYSYESRLEKLSEITSVDKRFKILTIEKSLAINLTADLFSYLKNALPNINFVFVVGSDLVSQIEKWEKFDELLNLTNIVIMTRGGYSDGVENSSLLTNYGKNAKIMYVKIDEMEISSTEIRKNEAIYSLS